MTTPVASPDILLGMVIVMMSFRLALGANLQMTIRERKKTNKHKQIHGIVPEMGGGQIVYVFPFFLGKKGNT